MVEKFKFILLEYYCCGLVYQSHFYCRGSSQGVFTFANTLPYLLISNKWHPWIGNSPSNNAVFVDYHCIFAICLCWYMYHWSQKGEIDFENFLNCLSFTVLISIFFRTKQRKRKKKYGKPYYLWMRKIILICHERCCCVSLMSVVIFNPTKQYCHNKAMN